MLPGYYEFGDLSNYVVVSSFFDVRVRSSSSSYDYNRRRRGGEAAPAAVAPPATIAAWSVCDGGFGEDGDEQNGKISALIEELGRATFAEEQDCKLVQDLIRKANCLMSLMVSAALKRQDKFMASLYYEEEVDDSVVVDITLSNHHHKEEDQIASETDNNHYNSLLWNNDLDNNNLPGDNNENIQSMLAQLAADTDRLFYLNCKKKGAVKLNGMNDTLFQGINREGQQLGNNK